MLVFALVRGNDDGWGSTLIVGLLVGAALLLTVFLVAEWRQDDPMLDLNLFRRPAMVGVSLAAFTLSASIFALFLYLTLYIQDDLGYGPLQAGVRFLPITMLAFIVAPIAGKLTVRIQSRYLLGGGLLLIAAGCLLMATTTRRLGLDRAAARLHRHRNRYRDREPGPCFVGHLRRATGTKRDGLGCQQHLPPSGDRHRHRRTRNRVPEPDPAQHPGCPRPDPGRPGGRGSWRCRLNGALAGGGVREAVTAIPSAAARDALLQAYRVGFSAHPRPSDGDRCGDCLPRLPRRLRLVRQRDFVPSYAAPAEESPAEPAPAVAV